MYIIQSLFFILQNEYMHCIKILHSCMIHFSCNKTCVEFCDLVWFEIRGAFCRYEQCLKMMQMLLLHLKQSLKFIETLTRLSYCITALVHLWRFKSISVNFAWFLESFAFCHQVHPNWYCCRHCEIGLLDSWQSYRIQWLSYVERLLKFMRLQEAPCNTWLLIFGMMGATVAAALTPRDML